MSPNPLLHHIGIDIGGTKISAGLLDSAGNLSGFTSIPTDSSGGVDVTQKRLEALIHELCQSAGISVEYIKGIGVGAPGPLDLKKGVINNPYTLPGLNGWNIVGLLSAKYGCPVQLENDADMAGLGEYAMRVNGSQECSPMLMLTLGTGVGGSLIYHGEVFRGAQLEHPEMGLVPVLENGTPCYSGVKGSLESWVSGSALIEFSRREGLSGPEEVFTSDVSSVLNFRLRMAEAWRRGIAIFLHTYYPAEIVLGGGIMDFHYPWFADLTVQAITDCRLIANEKTKVTPARLGNRAGVYGAAWMMQSRTK